VTVFLGSPGKIVEGKTEPPLENVTVVVDLGQEGLISVFTDESGCYKYAMSY
jgi:hypothetical protein